MYGQCLKYIPYLDAAKNNKDALAFTYLFDEFYPIVLRHLVINFRQVRIELLEDVAIESVEDWLLNLNKVDIKPYLIGFILCSNAKQKMFAILKPKTKFIPFSNFQKENGKDDSNFLDVLVYKELASVNYNRDLAKLTFQLKSKLDKYICELSDKDYKIITSYLNGGNNKKIAKDAGIIKTNVWRDTQNAFHNLKRIVNKSRNIFFDENRNKYLSKKIDYIHPKLMKLYYKDVLNFATISEVTGLDYGLIKGRIKRDTDLLKYDGLSYKMYKKKLKLVS